MSEALTYRLFEERDLPSLLRLWEEAGWGIITEEVWRRWYLETPYGTCLVVVAVDENEEVAAQKIFTPSRVIVDAEERRALRISAPIIRSNMRRDSLRRTDHPIVGLYMKAVEAAIEQGYDIIYSLPEHGWLPFFRWAPRMGLPRFAESEHACFALPLNIERRCEAVRPTHHLMARPVAEFGDDYDQLWAVRAH